MRLIIGRSVAPLNCCESRGRPADVTSDENSRAKVQNVCVDSSAQNSTRSSFGESHENPFGVVLVVGRSEMLRARAQSLDGSADVLRARELAKLRVPTGRTAIARPRRMRHATTPHVVSKPEQCGLVSPRVVPILFARDRACSRCLMQLACFRRAAPMYATRPIASGFSFNRSRCI